MDIIIITEHVNPSAFGDVLEKVEEGDESALAYVLVVPAQLSLQTWFQGPQTLPGPDLVVSPCRRQFFGHQSPKISRPEQAPRSHCCL